MPNLKEKKKDREPRFGIISFPDLNPLRGREEARDAAVDLLGHLGLVGHQQIVAEADLRSLAVDTIQDTNE